MARATQLDAQWATVRAARQAEQATPRNNYVLDVSSPRLVRHRASAAAEAAERREAALTITDMAADGHPCELDPDNNVKVCTHPDHARDADWARAALDVVGLDLTDDPELALADDPGMGKKDVRLGRTAFTRPDWRWQDSARCRGEDLVLFFGPDGERQPDREIRERKAKQICFACDVRTECLDYAISRPEKHGTWGGFGEEERASERRRRMRKAHAA